MLKKILRLSIVASVSCGLTIAPLAAYPVSMQTMFNSMSNSTPAGAYQGQTQNVYTGGNLSMVIPQKNYQLFSFSPPSISGGCNGINIFGGAFSHINAQQFVDMLKNIGSAALSQAFMMAIDAMSPMVGVNLKSLMKNLQDATNQSINSCAIGQSLANDMLGGSKLDGVKQWAKEHSTDTWTKANKSPDREAASAAINEDPVAQVKEVKQIIDTGAGLRGNLVWAALAKHNAGSPVGTDSHINEFEARLIISLIGSRIITNSTTEAAVAGSTGNSIPIAPFISTENLANFIGDPKSATLSNFTIYTCKDGDANGDATGGPSLDPDPNLISKSSALQCLGMPPVQVDSPSGGGLLYKNIYTMVSERMNSINNTIMNDSGAMSATDIAFINGTSVPIYKMLAVSNGLKGSGLGQVMINNNIQIIAMEYATTYLNGLFEIVLDGLSKMEPLGGGLYTTDIVDVKNNITEVRKSLAVQSAKAYAGQTAMYAIANQVADMEKTLMASLPNTISGAISTKRMRGQ